MWMKTFLKEQKPVIRTTTIYVVASALWIMFSDRLVEASFDDISTITQAQTYKGWFFVLASGLLIFVLMSNAMEKLKRTRLTLAETQSMQRTFLNKHYQPLWQTDEKGNCIFTNEKWEELTGIAIKNGRPLSWLQNVHPDDKLFCIDKFTQGLISRRSFSLEYRILDKDKAYRWVFNTCVPYTDSKEKYKGFTGFLFDIQEKKLLEERYRESSKRYGYLFANNPHPMLVYDTQDYRIMEVNKAALHLYGYNEKEMLSMSIIDLRPPTEIPVLMDHLSETLPEYHRSSGWIHKRKDGTTFDTEVVAHSLPPQNKRIMRLVIVRDITEQIQTFRSAREGQRRFNMLFDHNPYGSLICSEKLKIQQINASACSILNMDEKKAPGLSLKDLADFDQNPGLKEDIEKLHKGKPVMGEADFNHPDKHTIRVEYYAISFLENGKLKIHLSFNDIDEKHKIETALKESERLNATLIKNLPGMVYRCRNDKNWTMLFVSNGVKNLTGYTSSDILYNNKVAYAKTIHPDDRQDVHNLVEEAIHEKKGFELQYRIITRSGRLKWVWEQARGIYNAFDDLEYLEGYVIDITREKEARDEAEFQSRFLGIIIDNIPFPMFYKDTQGVFQGCNKTFCEYLKMDKDQIIGRTVLDLFEKPAAEQYQHKDQEIMKTGVPQVYETGIEFPDGRKMHALFHKSVFYDLNESPLGIMGFYFDITQRVKDEKIIKKQLEELARVNSELERFSYTVSHDLRSPLVTIKGFLGLLKEDFAENNIDQAHEDIRRIEDATDKMQQLLEDLLKLSRIGRTFDSFEEFSMTAAAKEAHELIFGLLNKKNFDVKIEEDMPMVNASKPRIRELMQNLLENAVKFSGHQAKPRIQVYSRKENNKVVFCVEDNGKGIDPEYHHKVFDLFSKLDTNTPGTGVGLSLVKRIVDNHNGQIWVESEGLDKGSVFCFTLNTHKKKDENTDQKT